MKETIIRTFTGIAFIGIVISSLLFHPLVYLVVFSLVMVVAWLEFAWILPEQVPPGTRIPVALILLLSFIVIYFLASGSLARIFLVIPATAPFLLLVIFGITRKSGKDASLPMTIGGMLYLLIGFSAMHILAFSVGEVMGYNYRWILFTFGFLWMNDTMAYVTGRLIGKNRMWPSVSPSKTWEGAVGGALFSVGLALLLSRYFSELSAWEWAVFAGIVIIIGTMGDLVESYIKRRGGVKDSGNILPGHGGILDRFDSFIPSIPAVAVYLNIIL